MNTGTIALSVTIAITAIVFYVLLKETSVFGKKYNDNYEMDVTKKLGYKVWTFMWIFTCLLSVIFNIVHGDWSGMDDLILLVGTTIIFVLLFSAWTFIRKKTVSGEHYSCQSQSPKELFELLGVEIINRHEDNVYTIAYQGGYFRFHFMENTEWVDIIFFDFDSCNLHMVTSFLSV